MATFPIFLSIVLVVRNQAQRLPELLSRVDAGVASLLSDYEIIVVDNGSDDDSVNVLKCLTAEDARPNLQVYALTKRVDSDTGSWVGLENALGDFVAVIDPLADDIGFLPEMLEKAVRGADVVFATNAAKSHKGWVYRCGQSLFNRLYSYSNGVQLASEAPPYRVLSKRVVNFILQHQQPATTYRHLPATGGFARVNLRYRWVPTAVQTPSLFESMDVGMRLLVSTTRAPMRLATSLSLFGAVANLLYSVYVVAVAVFKPDVAPGWVSVSLQQSGMFFLISLVLLMIGEYLLNMARSSNDGPLYHVGQEFTSVRMVRRERLNIEEVTPAAPKQRAELAA